MINYFSEDIDFALESEDKISAWLKDVCFREDYKIDNLNYIFCSDEYLHEMNVSYLSHDTLTDIITFDNGVKPHLIEGDIFISIDRVKENANTFGVPFIQELQRVIAHGLLHLLGYKDKSDAEKKEMRKREEACLSLLS